MGLADASPFRRLIDWSGAGSFWLLAMTGQRQRSRRQTLPFPPASPTCSNTEKSIKEHRERSRLSAQGGSMDTNTDTPGDAFSRVLRDVFVLLWLLVFVLFFCVVACADRAQLVGLT